MPFGEYLRGLREKRGRRQTEIAAAAGIGQTYLSDLERGVGTNPSREVLTGLARALNVPLADMMQAAWGEVRPELTYSVDLPRPIAGLIQNYGQYLTERDWERVAAYGEGLVAERVERAAQM